MGFFSLFSSKKEEEELQRIKEQLKQEIRAELEQENKTQKATNDLCPNCGRAYYRAEGGPESHYCKWCGIVFNANGRVVPNIIFRPADYFRNIWDIKNVYKYDTLSRRENHEFFSYLYNNFGDCEIKTKIAAKEIAPEAPEYAMPINFLITRDDKKVAVLLVEGDKCKRYSVLETMELCKENGITPLRFIIGRDDFFTNEEDYVVNRIKANL